MARPSILAGVLIALLVFACAVCEAFGFDPLQL